VVTDGELSDIGELPSTLTWAVATVVLPRDAVPGIALATLVVPERVQLNDSIPIDVRVSLWGTGLGDTLYLDVLEGERRLATHTFALPERSTRLHRRVTLPARRLGPGEHVLRLSASVDGDQEMRDNARQRVITVTEQPAIVLIVDPADWEGRFLLRVLSDVSGVPVRGYARIGESEWVDMKSLEVVAIARVRSSVRTAGLVIVRGSSTVLPSSRRGPVWFWPAGVVNQARFRSGDWYLTAGSPASPLSGDLARLEWDSLPPLLGVLGMEPDSIGWIAAMAQQGRRGASRPVLAGRVRGGSREMLTTGTGFWRWAFRGGAGLEAVRAILAAGIDWLLRSDRSVRGEVRMVADVVERGAPFELEWLGSSVPDSVTVRFTADSVDHEYVLFPDADGQAQVSLGPGTYRWGVLGATGGGLAVVEPYSDEYLPRGMATLEPRADGGWGESRERFLRQRWWFFFVTALVFAAEWAWRQRRGLP
jgi:hypothetical protein